MGIWTRKVVNSAHPHALSLTRLRIVGGGAAGTTLARNLAGGNRNIAVVDRGGFYVNADTRKLPTRQVVARAVTPRDRDRPHYLLGTAPSAGRARAAHSTPGTPRIGPVEPTCWIGPTPGLLRSADYPPPTVGLSAVDLDICRPAG
jgi:hypothetical protein